MKFNWIYAYVRQKKSKILRVMKLLSIFLLVFTTGVSAEVFSQNQLVSLKLHQCSVNTLFKEIRKQTGLRFVFNEEHIKTLGKLNITSNNELLKDLLDRIFLPRHLKCHFEQDVIFITPFENDNSLHEFASDSIPQKVIVKGKVVTPTGESLPGVTIVIKGTTLGTITDAKGLFTMTVPKGSTLMATFVGKKTKSITVKDNVKFFTIVLEDNLVQMDEVVITGYQMINPHEHVGVATKVKAEELDVANATKSIEQMLEGKVAGMHIANPSGAIGQKQRVKVRGTSSLLGNQEPVWVVDGIIQEDPLPFKTADFNAIADGMNEGTDLVKDFVGNAISWLNPNDIEDITVLKDVAATVLYGVKAANGVIVIRTKQGKEGRTSITYNGGLTYNAKPSYKKMYMMNSEERVDVSLEMIHSGRISAPMINSMGIEHEYQRYLNKEITYDEYRQFVNKMRHENTDWFDILLRNPLSQSHNLNISGGSKMINYYASIGYKGNKGQAKQNESSSYSANVSLNGWIVKDVLRFNAALRANITDTDGFNGQDPFSYARKTTRSLAAYDENGDPFFYQLNGGYLYNQEFENSQRVNKNSTHTVNGSLGLNWTILRGLRFNLTAAFGSSHVTGEAYSSERSNYITNIRKYEFETRIMSDLEYKISQLPHGGDLKEINSKNVNWTARAQIDYVKTFKRHRFSITAGSEMRSSKYTGYERMTYGYMHDKGRIITPPPILIFSDTYHDYVENPLYKKMSDKITDRLNNTLSFYSNISYAFDERYIFTASIRSDASNRFGESKREAFLPVYSFGLRWNVANEPWMTNINDYVNNLSIRASFGYQGNVAENYGSELVVRYGSSISQEFGELPLMISRLPYDDLSWEKTASYNLGIDLGLFRNKIQTSFNYYRKKTTDVITMADIAYEWGIASMPINDGTLTNQGWDLSVSFSPVKTKNFTWNVGLNTSKNYNKVKSKTEKKKDWREATSGNLVKTGCAYSTVWGFVYEGVDGQYGVPNIALVNEESKEYDINDASTWLKKLGKLEPTFVGGISTSFRYKTLSLSANFTLNVGAGRWLANYSTTLVPQEFDNLRRELVHRWRKPGDENIPGILPGLPYNPGEPFLTKQLPHEGTSNLTVNKYDAFNRSDARFVKANFLKCNSIRLAYSVPAKLLKKCSIKNLSASIGVSNPFKWVSDKFKGVDPEVATGGIPLPKTFTTSFAIGF